VVALVEKLNQRFILKDSNFSNKKTYLPRPTFRTPVLLLELPLALGAFLAEGLSSFLVVLFPKNLLDIIS
jgi:hypothetical protein